jgi:RHS repeat-associated protein
LAIRWWSEYLYLNGKLLAVNDLTTSTSRFVHTDHLGTPKVMTDQSGRIVWTASHDPFGAATVDEDPDGDGIEVVMNVRFPGQYYDSETGLHYNYFRYLDTQTGRCTTADPIGQRAGANLYTYVFNNPARWVAPFGLDSISLGFGGAFHYGPLGASASSSLGIDGNGKVCFQFTKCGQIGFGLQGGLSGGVNVSEGSFCEGDSSSEGVFADGALGLGLGGSISNDEIGNISAVGAKGVVGAGAAAGKQFCATRTV